MASTYAVIGGYGNEISEIVSITSVDSNTQLTISATKFAHSIDEPINVINYNQIQWASSSSVGGAKTTQGSNVSISVDDLYTESNLSSVTSGWVYARFYSVLADSYSAWSPAIPVSGFSENSLRYIIDQSRTRTQELTERLISDDDLLDIAREASDEIETIRKKWSFVQAENNTQLTAARVSYYKPTDLAGPDSIERLFLTEDNNDLDYYDSKEYWYHMRDIPFTKITSQITAASTTINVTDTGAFGTTGTLTIAADTGIIYTGKGNKQFTGVTGISKTHTSNAEVFRTSDLDQPTAYSWWNEHILYYPPPDKFYNAHMLYYKTIGRMTDVTIETVVPFPHLFVWYLMSQIFYMRKKVARAGIYEKKFKDGLKMLAKKNRNKQIVKMQPALKYIRRAQHDAYERFTWKEHGST